MSTDVLELHLRGEANICNAIRRTLISDLTCFAPLYVEIEKNTSHNTDEDIAHKIGLVPFMQPDKSVSNAWSRVSAISESLRAENIVPEGNGVHVPIMPSTQIIHLQDMQEFEGSVFFGWGTGKDHSRFARTTAVGMMPTSSQHDTHVITFGTVIPGDGAKCVDDAFRATRERLERAYETLLAM